MLPLGADFFPASLFGTDLFGDGTCDVLDPDLTSDPTIPETPLDSGEYLLNVDSATATKIKDATLTRMTTWISDTGGGLTAVDWGSPGLQHATLGNADD